MVKPPWSARQPSSHIMHLISDAKLSRCVRSVKPPWIIRHMIVHPEILAVGETKACELSEAALEQMHLRARCMAAIRRAMRTPPSDSLILPPCTLACSTLHSTCDAPWSNVPLSDPSWHVCANVRQLYIACICCLQHLAQHLYFTIVLHHLTCVHALEYQHSIPNPDLSCTKQVHRQARQSADMPRMQTWKWGTHIKHLPCSGRGVNLGKHMPRSGLPS